MSQPDNLPFQLFNAPIEILDVAASGTYSIDRSPCVINMVSAAAESRTLDRPTRAGAILSLHMQTDGGDITLTVTGGYDELGTTTMTFSDVGQYAVFQSYMTSAGVFFWRLLSTHAFGNLAALLATAAEINRVADVSTRKISLTTTPVTLDEATHEGKVIVLNKADALAVTMPAATGSGAKYEIYVGTTASGGSYTIVRDGSDVFKGVAVGDDGDGEPANAWSTVAATTITMDGSTQGGIAGDRWYLTDIASAVWSVAGFITQSGTEATPFS